MLFVLLHMRVHCICVVALFTSGRSNQSTGLSGRLQRDNPNRWLLAVSVVNVLVAKQVLVSRKAGLKRASHLLGYECVALHTIVKQLDRVARFGNSR